MSFGVGCGAKPAHSNCPPHCPCPCPGGFVWRGGTGWVRVGLLPVRASVARSRDKKTRISPYQPAERESRWCVSPRTRLTTATPPARLCLDAACIGRKAACLDCFAWARSFCDDLSSRPPFLPPLPRSKRKARRRTGRPRRGPTPSSRGR